LSEELCEESLDEVVTRGPRCTVALTTAVVMRCTPEVAQSALGRLRVTAAAAVAAGAAAAAILLLTERDGKRVS
jgi:hypothetical protein